MYLLASDPAEVDIRFYQGYDAYFLETKAKILLREFQRLEARVQEANDQERGCSPEFRAALSCAIEIHCTVSHLFESVFALFLAGFQSAPHWVFLTEYHNRDVKQAVTSWINGEVERATYSRFSDRREALVYGVFAGREPVSGSGGEWRAALDDLGWIFEVAGERYLKAAEFNAYKHGIRIHPSQALMTLELSEGQHLSLIHMPNSVTYLEREALGNGQVGFQVVTKEVRVSDSMQWIRILTNVAATIAGCRLSALTGNDEYQPRIVRIDREGLLSMGGKSTFSVTL